MVPAAWARVLVAWMGLLRWRVKVLSCRHRSKHYSRPKFKRAFERLAIHRRGRVEEKNDIRVAREPLAPSSTTIPGPWLPRPVRKSNPTALPAILVPLVPAPATLIPQ